MSTTSAARTTRRRTAALAASCAVVGLLLAGCAASSGSDTSAAAGDRVVEAPAPAVGSGGGVVTDSSGEGVGEGKDSGGQPLAATLARSVIVRADMTVRVADLDDAYAAMSLAAGRHGAVIASQTTSEGDLLPEPMPVDEKGMTTCPSTGCPTSYASSTTTYRVDNDEVDALIRDLGDLGTVEASYAHHRGRHRPGGRRRRAARTARASLARVRVLMDKAATIADVVALEGELSRRQADLESLQAQQRVLADQTAQATVTVRLVRRAGPRWWSRRRPGSSPASPQAGTPSPARRSSRSP